MKISINESLIIKNVMANEEIVRFDQFLLLPQWFQKSSAACLCQKASICGKGLTIKLPIMEIVQVFVTMFSSSAADLLIG